MKVLLDHLRSSLWPIPLAMLLAAVLLVELAAWTDHRLAGAQALRHWWLHSGSGQDASNLLSTLASAIITLAGVVFSITIVALTLAANQFGSRLVRTYITDLRTKFSLGFFLLTAVYCLLALRLVTQDMSREQVPHVTVTLGLVLSVACVLVLVFFLHVMARSIVADEVVRRVAAELDAAIECLPDLDQADAAITDQEALLPPDFEQESRVLRSAAEGYVQEVHYEALLAQAEAAGVLLRIDVAAGDYLCKSGWLGRIYPSSVCDEEVLRTLRASIVLGAERTPVQDLAFPMRHLVDVALRALSPGINDPNTALVVIDRLRGALARLLRKSLPTGIFPDRAGRYRLWGRRRTHAELMAGALRPIRDAAARQPLVVLALLEALQKLAEHASTPEQFEAIRSEAGQIVEVALVTPMAASQADAIRRAESQLSYKLQLVSRELLQFQAVPAIAGRSGGG